MAKKKAVKKSFTPEAKAEALRLISEGHTRKEVAAQIGCSTAAIQLWKVEAKSGKIKAAAKSAESVKPAAKSVKKAKKTKRRRKGVRKTTVATTPAAKPLITFDEFVQGYWSGCKGAMDIMRLPPDVTPKAIQYIHEVLRYAYNRFSG